MEFKELTKEQIPSNIEFDFIPFNLAEVLSVFASVPFKMGAKKEGEIIPSGASMIVESDFAISLTDVQERIETSMFLNTELMNFLNKHLRKGCAIDDIKAVFAKTKDKAMLLIEKDYVNGDAALVDKVLYLKWDEKESGEYAGKIIKVMELQRKLQSKAIVRPLKDLRKMMTNSKHITYVKALCKILDMEVIAFNDQHNAYTYVAVGPYKCLFKK